VRSPPPQNRPADLHALTGARAAAALFVCLHHFPLFRESESAWQRWLYDRWLVEGYIGVGFFFVLSGFVLAHAYGHRCQTFLSRDTLEFFVARLAKLLPLHWLTLAITLALFTPASALSALPLLANATLTQSFFPMPDVYFSYNAVSWSLSDELFFYALFPALAMSVLRLQKLRSILAGVAVLWVAQLVGVALLADHPRQHWLIYVNPLARFAEFALGGLLLKIHQATHQRALTFRSATWVEAGAVLILAALIYFHDAVAQAYRYSSLYLPALLVLVFAMARGEGAVSRVLGSRKMRYLGQLSFAFYLVHQLVIAGVERGLATTGITLTAPALAALCVAIAFLASIPCHHWVELPVQRWVRQAMAQKAPLDART
jgi:peptidoglycan/LPS O-acetylase OafA/YrhL